jgi:hypothetical protein
MVMPTCAKCSALIGPSELIASTTGTNTLGPFHYPQCPDSTQVLKYAPCPTCGKEAHRVGPWGEDDKLVPYLCGTCGGHFGVTLSGT